MCNVMYYYYSELLMYFAGYGFLNQIIREIRKAELNIFEHILISGYKSFL